MADQLARQAKVPPSTILKLAIDEGLPRLEAHLLLWQLEKKGKTRSPRKRLLPPPEPGSAEGGPTKNAP